MNIQDQVVSIELAKKLKELGVREESLFAYYGNAGVWHESIVSTEVYSDATEDFKDAKLLPAYTVAELGEMMKGKGMGVTAFDKLGEGQWWVRGGKWIVEKQQYSHLTTNEKWADCLAAMLIHLIKNNLYV